MSFQAITNLSRFKDIVAVFVKHGFEDVVRALDLPGKSFTGGGGRPHEQPDSFQHLRLALEELGPAFIKFGQIMSLRSELLPAALIEELGKLQDQVPPEEFDGIREVIETSIGKPLNEAFVLLDEQPVAAASLSQVHRAVLRESRIPVALKVQRPGIRSKIETDLDIMDYAANLLHKRSPNLELYDLPGLVKSIRQTLLRELDFTREARHMQIARNLMKDLSGIHVPRVYAELTRERLLVMEYVQGSKIKETDRHNRPNAEALAKSGLKAVVKQILEHGFFHADPHPGNLLISDDGTLSLLDWGMIGRLTGQERRELLNLMTAIVEKDAQLMTEAIMVITYGRENLDRQELERSLLNLLDYHVTASLEELRLDRLIVDMLEIVREFQLRIPANHFITLKALTTAEGAARQLYPQLDVVGELEPDVRRLATLPLKPEKFWRQLRTLIFEAVASPTRLPRQVGEIIRKLEKGDLRLRFEHYNLSELRTTMDKAFSRMTMGIIAAAMIIGSSLIITTGIPPLILGYPVLGLAGYLISALLGLWIVFDILRSP